MKENILILGAGLMQKPAIECARKIANTVVIDADPHAVCVPLAHEFRNVDLKDREGILKLAEELNSNGNKLKGIFTAGTDFSASVSYAGEKLGLYCHSFDSALNASNKNLMRECFKKAHVPSPDFIVQNEKTFSLEQIKSFTAKNGFPFVVKPCDNMGARGCRMVRSENEIESAVKDGFTFSRSHTIIIEQYMDGPEFSIDALVYQGSVTITGFADRHIYYPPYFIETGHTMPASIDFGKKKELTEAFVKGIKSLGLTCGAAKADIKYTKNGPMIGEIAARLSGGYMSGWTFPYSSDFNLTEEALKIACGMVPDNLLKMREPVVFEKEKNLPFEVYEISSVKSSAERAWISIPGTVKSVENYNEEKDLIDIKNIFPRNINPGDKVDFPRNNVSKCGNIISLAPSIGQACEESEKACSKMFVRLEPSCEETEKFLNGFSAESEDNFPPDFSPFYPEIKDLNIEGSIPAGSSAEKHIPDMLKKYFNSEQTGWNYLTLSENIKMFDRICPDHPELDNNRFWKAFFRGGLQAIVYVSDTFSDKIK